MAVSAKRTRSGLGFESLCSPVKRRTLALGGSSGNGARLGSTKVQHGAANACTSTVTGTATTTNTSTAIFTPCATTSSCGSSHSEDTAVHSKVGEVRKKLNQDLLLAMCHCADSDMGSGTDWENLQEINDCRKKGTSSRPSSFLSKKNQTPKIDLIARERCFDYIVQSIDEVWARYCDTTSTAEAAFYGDAVRSNCTVLAVSSLSPSFTCSCPNKDLKVAVKKRFCSEACSEAGEELLNESRSNGANHGDSRRNSEDTNTTDYDTDHSESRTVSNLPDPIKLQCLKRRLTKAKEDLEQVYDSTEYADCCSFWQRWDMAKYSAVEMMEEDDDDEIIENVIEELEKGRCYVN